MKTETISERVKQLIEHEGISVMGFEKKINVGNNSIGTGIKRKSNLSGDILSKILNCYDYINPKWLLTGKGEMLIENLSIVSEPAAAYNITKKKGKQINLFGTYPDWLEKEGRWIQPENHQGSKDMILLAQIPILNSYFDIKPGEIKKLTIVLEDV